MPEAESSDPVKGVSSLSYHIKKHSSRTEIQMNMLYLSHARRRRIIISGGRCQ